MDDPKYSVEPRWGGGEDEPTPSRLAEIVRELDVKDGEHPDTWLTHTASGWLLRLDEDAFAYLEDNDLNVVSHMRGVSRAYAIDLWLRFAHWGPRAVESEPWVQGPRVFSREELEAQRELSERMTLESHRAFFESLGQESVGKGCKKEGCTRGTVAQSVFCRIHHFEQIRGVPCPFT
jgi:hypothetical protein